MFFMHTREFVGPSRFFETNERARAFNSFAGARAAHEGELAGMEGLNGRSHTRKVSVWEG